MYGVRLATPDDDIGCSGHHILVASQINVSKVIWPIFQYSEAQVQAFYGSIHIFLWYWLQFIVITFINFIRR